MANLQMQQRSECLSEISLLTFSPIMKVLLIKLGLRTSIIPFSSYSDAAIPTSRTNNVDIAYKKGNCILDSNSSEMDLGKGHDGDNELPM